MRQRKTRAMQVLETKGITYEVRVYDGTGAFHRAEEVAKLLGLRLEVMYKTLVVLRDALAAGRPIIVMVKSDAEVDLKLLASELGEKRLRMATHREAERLTGMQAGGISVLGLKRSGFDVLIDERARGLDTIHISAGERGIEIALKTAVTLSGASYVRTTR